MFKKMEVSQNRKERRIKYMQQNYPEVPNIITGKDLDYLCDMFQWNCEAAKMAHHFQSEVQDETLRTMLDSVYQAHMNQLQTVLSLLQEGGSANGQ